jgi:hypothetical protein
VRFRVKHRLPRAPVPLTDTAVLRRGMPFAPASWPATFRATLADEAADRLQLLADLERI